MQPHRTAKPHAGTDAQCAACAPTGPGHHLCQCDGCDGCGPTGCDEVATMQTRRHASDAEYAAIPATLAPIDGIAHQVVHGCDECTEDGMFTGFCTHPEPAAVPCPKCHAVGEQPCTAKNGDPRYAPHTVRTQAQPTRERCTHAHRPDCQVFTGCQCTENDPDPARPKRPSGEVHWPDMALMRIPVPAAQMLIAQHGIAWHQVAAIRSKITQLTGEPAIDVEIYQTSPAGDRIYDEHGKPVTETVEILLPIRQP